MKTVYEPWLQTLVFRFAKYQLQDNLPSKLVVTEPRRRQDLKGLGMIDA